MAEAALPALKSFKVSAGYKYGYVYTKPQGSKPTFLLLHGFPSSVYDWRFQIADLSAAGYGVLAPDLLGYGSTDKPTAVEEYKYSKMSKHISEILDHEGVKEVIGVGHDWGSFFLGKVVNFYPKYFKSLVFTSVPYLPGSFDLDGINQQTEAAFGYPVFGYMYWLNETNAAKDIEKNIPSFLSLVYPEKPEVWRTDFSPVGKAKDWVQASKFSPLPRWETKVDREYRINLFKYGGFTGPLNWYKVPIRDLDAAAVGAIPPENLVLNQPVLFLGGAQDPTTRIEVMQQIADLGKSQGWLPTVQVKAVEGGSHWLLLEKPKEVFTILDGVAKSLPA
ncbi:alpha/beta-hydrolase [Byssothecium circinans]|uniref:Alpha/beta-hydrolase n=1 Tax=Byssothecium circinans TaxID=147558 RepID=A0A6A5UA17_9PLEO|nr:alpha/beta-hydrolase [Byssothecium circinans]